MNPNDHYLYRDLLQVIREAEAASMVSETVNIMHGHPWFHPVENEREDGSCSPRHRATA
jgi:hypothetical protein